MGLSDSSFQKHSACDEINGQTILDHHPSADEDGVKLDGKRLARKKWFWQRDKKDKPGDAGEPPKQEIKRPWLSVWNEELWTRICKGPDW